MPFAKHETFHIREGWLFKGMDAIGHDSTIFLVLQRDFLWYTSLL